jgi:hypothetical protein
MSTDLREECRKLKCSDEDGARREERKKEEKEKM